MVGRQSFAGSLHVFNRGTGVRATRGVRRKARINVSQPRTANVVIIGAGAIGCSSAYHLVKAGITDIVVVEMDEVCSGSSGKTAGMLMMQLSDALSITMAKYSYSRFMQFEEELGVSPQFRKNGYVALATPETAANLYAQAALLKSLGVPTEELTPLEIGRLFPEINTSDLAVGTFGPDDGTFDPCPVVWGYIHAAMRSGVKLLRKVRATGIRMNGDAIAGVETTDGFIACEWVINAAGAWAKDVGSWVGLNLPIKNTERTIAVTAPFDGIPSNRPCIEDMTVEWYYRPEGGGILMGAGAKLARSPTPFPTGDSLDELFEYAVHRVPMLENAQHMTAWTGIRSMTPDFHPLVGTTSVPGFVLNCGWGGEGVMQSPIGGKMIADHISNVVTSEVDISRFRMDRFSGLDISKWVNFRIFNSQDESGNG